MRAEDVTAELDKPIAQQLLYSGELARLAYNGRDGYPRAVPVAFYWDTGRRRVVICTPTNSAKAPALRERPQVALTIDTDTREPRALLIRGTAELDVIDGVPDEYLRANSKVGEPEQWHAFEAQVRGLYDQMVRISIEPTWAKLLDFESTIPRAVEEIVREKYPEMLPAD